MPDEKEYYFDKPENVSFVLRIFYTICGLLAVADIFIHRHTIHSWEDLTGFYAIYGFVACVALVRIATQMRKVLMRDEDYYDNE
jgi:hypothetical protein